MTRDYIAEMARLISGKESEPKQITVYFAGGNGAAIPRTFNKEATK